MEANQEKRIEIIKNAVFSFKMEGIGVSKKTIKDGLRILNGEVTADDLIHKYKEDRNGA